MNSLQEQSIAILNIPELSVNFHVTFNATAWNDLFFIGVIYNFIILSETILK